MANDLSDRIQSIVADQLGGDGLTWETSDGVDLGELCSNAGACVGIQEVAPLTRYLFPDGSAIVASGEAWDIEGPTPYSWESLGK